MAALKAIFEKYEQEINANYQEQEEKRLAEESKKKQDYAAPYLLNWPAQLQSLGSLN